MKQLLFFALILTFFAGASSAQIAPELRQRMDEVGEGQFLPVIVGFQETFDVAEIVSSQELRGDSEAVRAQTIGILKDRAQRAHHWTSEYCAQRNAETRNFQSFWISNMVGLEATPAAIREIAQQPGVSEIFLDEEQVFVDYRPSEPQRDAWGLEKIGSKKVNMEFKGRNVVVAVLDTGVNYNHNDLKGRVLLGKDCYNNDMDPMDDNGHGSHCAGTIAGTEYGVAPEATILAVQVLSGGGSGSWQNVADGVQYVADYKHQGKSVPIASMSLGGRAPIQAVLRQAFDNAVAMGICFAIAAGNSGPGAKTIGTPGDQKDVLSVGATDSSDSIASFSSRGPVVAYGGSYIKPDVSAPGVSITSCWKGGATATNTISGTSMATPHVAGLMALMVHANHKLTSQQIRDILQNTALDLGTPGQDTVFGFGRIQAEKAVVAAKAALELSQSRIETEKDIVFPISNGKIAMQVVKENPLWDMRGDFWVTILNPAGTYDGTFTVTAPGEAPQKGTIAALPSGQLHYVGRFNVYYGDNTIQLNGQYNGTENVTEGTIRVRAKIE